MTVSLPRRALLGTALALPAIRRAHAEVSEVLIAKQFGTLYMQQDVMQELQLLEKHGAKLGLPALRASYLRFAGTGPVQDGLISGKLHFASGGAPGAMLLWDRTKGAVKSAFAMNATNQKLVSVNPKVTAVRDLTPDDRIALPAAKTSPQAIFLQMAAAAAFGKDQWSRFDAQTISRGHPDSMAQMLARTEVTCHWSSTPFQERELANPACHEVTNSYDVMGLPAVTPITMYANTSFRTENPLAWKATMAAFQEATDFINANPQQAAELYLKSSGDKDTVAGVMASMASPGNSFTLRSAGVMQMAAFMSETGILKRRPAGLADIFFPDGQELGGS